MKLNGAVLCFAVFAQGLLVGGCALSQPTDSPDAPSTQPAGAQAQPEDRPQLADVEPKDEEAQVGMKIDKEARSVTLQAKVVLREGWLETLACRPGTKEHESLLVIETPPSVVHFGLLAVGAQPGEPLKLLPAEDNEMRALPPVGQAVKIEFTYELAGQKKTVPAQKWVSLNNTEELLPDDPWVFAGSELRKFGEEKVYMADIDGIVISLVNFGSDMLARNHSLTDNNAVHNMAFTANTALIPEVGTSVEVRLIVTDQIIKREAEE